MKRLGATLAALAVIVAGFLVLPSLGARGGQLPYPNTVIPLSGTEQILTVQLAQTVSITPAMLATYIVPIAVAAAVAAPVPLTTVAGLPTCNSGSEGVSRGVTDALYPSYLAPLLGGGSTHAPAYCDGTNWIAH